MTGTELWWGLVIVYTLSLPGAILLWRFLLRLLGPEAANAVPALLLGVASLEWRT